MCPFIPKITKNPLPWTSKHTYIVKMLKEKVHSLPCLCIPNPNALMIVETDASELGYGGILKKWFENSSKEELVRFYSGVWSGPQKDYSTIKKEMFQLFNVF